jgi:hypothetical protein
LPARAVRRAALAAEVALVSIAIAAATGAATGGVGLAGLRRFPAVRRRSAAHELEAVVRAAVAVFLAGISVGGAIARLFTALSATLVVVLLLLLVAAAVSTTVAIVASVVLALVALLSIALLAAPPYSFVRSLGSHLAIIEANQRASERQRGQHSQQAAPRTTDGKGTCESIEARRFHGVLSSPTCSR